MKRNVKSAFSGKVPGMLGLLLLSGIFFSFAPGQKEEVILTTYCENLTTQKEAGREINRDHFIRVGLNVKETFEQAGISDATVQSVRFSLLAQLDLGKPGEVASWKVEVRGADPSIVFSLAEFEKILPSLAATHGPAFLEGERVYIHLAEITYTTPGSPELKTLNANGRSSYLPFSVQ